MKGNDSTDQGNNKTYTNKDKSCNLKKHKKSNSRPNRVVWTVFVNCAHWRGSTLAIYKTVLIIFPLNLQTITITLDVVKWRWGGEQTDRMSSQFYHLLIKHYCGISWHKHTGKPTHACLKDLSISQQPGPLTGSCKVRHLNFIKTVMQNSQYCLLS